MSKTVDGFIEKYGYREKYCNNSAEKLILFRGMKSVNFCPAELGYIFSLKTL